MKSGRSPQNSSTWGEADPCVTKTTVLVDLRPGTRLNDQRLAKQIKLLEELADEAGSEGSVWVHTRNRATATRGLLPWPALLTRGIHDAGFMRLRNVLVFHEPHPMQHGVLHPTYSEVLWFVPNNRKYFFDKDTVREPHIFKDLEWGRRTVGPTSYRDRKEAVRYSKGGRDPGNVFYDVRRTDSGTVSSVHAVDSEQLYERIVKATTKPGWTVRTNLDERFCNAITKLGRTVVKVEKVP
jgi:hypothetical protein